MKTLIKGGHVIDPANLTDSDLDLLIEDGRIKSVLSPADALHPSDGKCLPDQVIDASGMIVCPGFIDMHMHEDPMEEGGRIRQCIFPAMLRQGVTTVLAGNCGDNAADPVRYLEEGKLDEWIRKKAIQKALESRRVSDEHKEYLKSLRVRRPQTD